MTDQAHVQTKSAQSLAESRDITVIQFSNPGSSPVINYRTAIDPALVSSKPVPVDMRAVDLNSESVPLWYSKYGTGLSSAEIYHKTSILPGGSQQVTIGDAPFVHDIGAVVGLPDIINSNLDDDWHKNVVTDLASCDVVVGASLVCPSMSYFGMTDAVYLSQYMLFPVSARHVIKTSDGVLHAVTSYAIDGISRIVYLVSVNGGEQWTANIVDNDDGHHYIFPSITCDRDNGIHITYTRFDLSPTTYWLYKNNDIPTGFSLVSDASSDFGSRVLSGGVGEVASLGYNDDHDHSYTLSGGSVNSCVDIRSDLTGLRAAGCGWHHSDLDISFGFGSHLPPYRTMRVISYPGIPPSLPAGVVLPFDQAVPSGYTRYSAQDGYNIRGSDVVGTVGGSLTHYHILTHSLDAPTWIFNITTDVYNGNISSYRHAHSETTTNLVAANNSPPSHKVVLGELDSIAYTIPSHSLLMTSDELLLSFLTQLSGAGGALSERCLIGASTYESVDGSVSHTHPDIHFDSLDASGYHACLNDIEWDTSVAACHHYHSFLASSISSENSLPSQVLPYIAHIDSEIDCTRYGSDLFYRYISPANVMSSPVNISLIRKYFPSIEGVCLADDVDDIHFLWSAQGLNTSPDKGRICYKKMTSGVLGSREDLTTSDEHMLYPSMDIDVNGDVHAAWFNADTFQSVQYCKRASGSWGSVEDVDTSSYVGFPSNIITDKDCNVFLLYSKWTDALTAIKEVMYRKRVASTSTWSDATNLSPGMAVDGYNQFPGQIYLDNKGNVVFTWSGKGYGAHTSVYHPVYRYRTSAGTIVPALTEDAVDLFPDDDNEILYPTVFWHSFPLIDSVYHNLVTSGLTFVYLYNIRGVAKDTADLKFYSSPDALVGDVGSVGQGGGCEGEFNPGAISAESILNKESFSISQRGHICRSKFVRTAMGNYLI